MRKLLLLCAILLLGISTTYAQAPNSVQCNLSNYEILQAQSLELDHPKQIRINEIASDLFIEIKIVYDLINEGNTDDLAGHFETIAKCIEEAKDLEMNYSMFQEDLDLIETFK